jgi:hypothetical protein
MANCIAALRLAVHELIRVNPFWRFKLYDQSTVD